MVALEEFADSLAGSADGVRFPVDVASSILESCRLYLNEYLPSRVDSRRLSLVQSRCLVVLVETDNQRTDTKRTDTTTLCIPLLHAGDVLGDIFNRDWVLHGQTV